MCWSYNLALGSNQEVWNLHIYLCQSLDALACCFLTNSGVKLVDSCIPSPPLSSSKEDSQLAWLSTVLHLSRWACKCILGTKERTSIWTILLKCKFNGCLKLGHELEFEAKVDAPRQQLWKIHTCSSLNAYFAVESSLTYIQYISEFIHVGDTSH